jgi:preprotein translocase subunit SecE
MRISKILRPGSNPGDPANYIIKNMFRIFRNIRDFFSKVGSELRQVDYIPGRKAFGWGFFVFVFVVVSVFLIFLLDIVIIKLRDVIIF